jgi:tetratricopeptide (TPR) repeat protein
MEQAAAGAPSDFDEAWALVIIGNLELQRSDLEAVRRAYERAEQALPGEAMVQAALARVAIAEGDVQSAETLFRDAVGQRPLPEYAIALGELLESQGRTSEAEEQYALVRATQQLLAASGVDTDIELALFDADHGGDPEAAYQAALAAYARRPSIFSADTVAWAAFKSGRIDEARRYSQESLRVGTNDARLLYHAGMIAHAAGDTQGARAYLEQAVAMEPAQSLLYANTARETLADLTAAVVH